MYMFLGYLNEADNLFISNGRGDPGQESKKFLLTHELDLLDKEKKENKF